MRTNTWLIALFVSAVGCNEITQDDQIIILGKRVHHQLELGVERFLLGEYFYSSRSIPKDQRNKTQSMGDSQSHDTLGDKCDLSNHKDQSVCDGHRHSFKMPLRTAGLVVSLPTLTDPSAPMTSEKTATLTRNRLSSADN